MPHQYCRIIKGGNDRSLAVAGGGGDLKRFSVDKMEFPAHSATSKTNPFPTKAFFGSALRKGMWRREDEHLSEG